MDHDKDGKMTSDEFMVFNETVFDFLRPFFLANPEVFQEMKDKFFDPANHESPAVFLKVADPDLRGYFDFEGYVAG